MVELAEGLPPVLRLVTNKEKHRDYARVVKLSDHFYRPLITGEGAGHLIHRFNPRESVEGHAQRILLTQLVSPSIHNGIMAPARKIQKVNPTINRADYGPTEKDKTKKLQEATNKFYGGKDVDHFMGSILLDQGAIDPNAFCIISFSEFDHREQTPQVYPAIVSCKDAWNFEYHNGELQWLLVHRDITYTKVEKAQQATKKEVAKPEQKITLPGNYFCLYLANHQVTFTQVDPATIRWRAEDVLIEGKNGKAVLEGVEMAMNTKGKYYYRVTTDELYEVVFYENLSGMVPAFRLGYIPDHTTNGRTMVNLWHPALPYFMKGVKSGSELDLSASLHAFLQKLQYANPCKGFTDEGGNHWDCKDGREPGGKKLCRKCSGSGWDVIVTAQDHMTFRMPRTKDEFLDLANMVHYVPLPVETLTWQDGYFDKLENKCYRTVYNSERFRADQVQSTATGERIDYESVYDTLGPACSWWSQNRVLIYKLTGSYVVGSDSLKQLTVIHTFPRNLRYESLAELVTAKKSMSEASVSTGLLIEMDYRVNDSLNQDDPEAKRRNMVRMSLDPFLGKSEATITTMISQDNTPKRKKVLWFNFHDVLAECEEKAAERTGDDGMPVNFYYLDRKEQRKMIDEVVSRLMDEIDEEAPEVPKLPMGITPADGGEEQKATAPGEQPPPAATGVPATAGKAAA